PVFTSTCSSFFRQLERTKILPLPRRHMTSTVVRSGAASAVATFAAANIAMPPITRSRFEMLLMSLASLLAELCRAQFEPTDSSYGLEEAVINLRASPSSGRAPPRNRHWSRGSLRTKNDRRSWLPSRRAGTRVSDVRTVDRAGWHSGHAFAAA